MRLVKKETKVELSEILMISKDKRFEWVWWDLLDSIRTLRKKYIRVMNYEGYDYSRTPGMIREYNENVIRLCGYAKEKSQKYRHDRIAKLIGTKLNYFTNKDGTLFEKRMSELYEWGDDKRILKKIADVENYSRGRIEKYARKRG